MLGNISREFWLENFFAAWPRARAAFSKESLDCWKLMKRVTYPTNQKKKLGHLIIIISRSIFSLYTSISLSPPKGYLLHHQNKETRTQKSDEDDYWIRLLEAVEKVTYPSNQNRETGTHHYHQHQHHCHHLRVIYSTSRIRKQEHTLMMRMIG